MARGKLMVPRLPRVRRLQSFAIGLAFSLIALVLLLAPALWNGYPLLQYDTGGYLARWYEGYLVPSRSTLFGLYLHLGEGLHFWPMVAAQSALTVWIVMLTLRAFGIADRWRAGLAIIAALSLVTTLPFLTAILLTDIFAGLGVLALHLLVLHARALRRIEQAGLFLVIAFAAATHSATFAMLLALVAAGIVAVLVLRARIPARGLAVSGAAIGLGALMLVTTNAAFSGRFAWTPGGYGIAFGRMLQDGIVARYLEEHCPDARLKLCPYRNRLPATADEFLWDYGVFNELGRFTGLGEEMRTIALGSLVAYPGTQLVTAARATAQQLVMVASGGGVHDQLWHTYGIIERFIPGEVPAMRAAKQQQSRVAGRAPSGGDVESYAFDFTAINRVHVPVAWLSMLALLVLLARLRRDPTDDLALLAASTTIAILANAFVCGALSGPHDRYGARIAWIASLVVLLAAARAWAAARDQAKVRHGTVMAAP
jgi:hypothetical protein